MYLRIISRFILLRVRNLCPINFFPRKSCRYRGNARKYGTARQATDDNIIWRMCIACWKNKATNTELEYAILITLPWQQYVGKHVSLLTFVRTLPAFL